MYMGQKGSGKLGPMMPSQLLVELRTSRGIVKKRKDFEYKIQRHAKCKEDYLRYIQFEMDLLKRVKTRRENMGLGNKKDVEFAIANRVNRLFSKAIKRFPSDVRIWISYIKFCKQMSCGSHSGTNDASPQ
ncbi:U3 small nucleolar RNA-associated protein 6 homolog [Periplaneta americana]|uniref:U3 small nucleolar RNA-associated protein 6 homolog n=1 Tax=Periplaneta americana TaxID=6978 RepID=UPI0037E8104A